MSRRSYGTGSLSTRPDKHGRATWYLQWRHEGVKAKKRVGLVRTAAVRGDGTFTRAQAEAESRRLMEVHAQEVALKAESRPGKPGRSFDQLADAYLDHLTMIGRKKSTVGDVRGHLKHWLRPYFASTPVEEITRDQVKALVLLMLAGERPSGIDRDKPLSPKSIQNIIGNLSAMLRWGSREGWRQGNPAEGLDLPAPRTSDEIRWLEPDEVRLLAAHAYESPYKHLDQALYFVAAMTGLRQGELVELRWRDIDWTAGAIRVRRSFSRNELGTPKSRRSVRSVPMADDVAAVLEDLSKRVPDGADDLVFPSPLHGGHLPAAQMLRRMRRALRAAGLDERHVFHDLRHTFGTQMAAQGVPMRVLQEWMGHRDIATTQRYADYSPRHDERALVQAAFARRTGIVPAESAEERLS